MAARLVSLSSVALTRYSSFSGLLPLARMELSGSTDKVVPQGGLGVDRLEHGPARDEGASACASAWFDSKASSVVAAVIGAGVIVDRLLPLPQGDMGVAPAAVKPLEVGGRGLGSFWASNSMAAV